MLNRLIVIGASAGGVEALKNVVNALPADLDAAVVIVLHLYPRSKSYLDEILARSAKLPVTQSVDQMPLRAGTVYVAPPDFHILVGRDRVILSRGPRENRHRPSINALFSSAAQEFGPDVIGVILTGSLDDGTAGLWEIKRAGGVAIVQDPEDALFPEMPQSALAHVDVDFVVKLSQIAPLLATLVQSVPSQTHPSGFQEGAVAPNVDPESPFMHSKMTDFTCPECHGAIREQRFGGVLQYACRVGHTYTAKTMLESHVEAEENALWAAVVALEEGADLFAKIASFVPGTRDEFERQAEIKRTHAKAVRYIIANISSGKSEQQLLTPQ